MVKLADTQRSGRCGSNPMRVQVPLRAPIINFKFMSFNSFEKGYDKNEVNWQKSISEIAKFITDHLDNKGEFFEFLNSELDDKEKCNRWQSRLDDLLDKITKRTGYRIDQDKLFSEAYEMVEQQCRNGELNPSKGLDYFCSNLEELKEKRAVLQEF